jgi:hypothetical protein
MPIEEAEVENRIRALFNLMGNHPRECKSCGAPIYWITTKAGRRMPITQMGISHFADCPNANQHRSSRKTGSGG